VPGLLVRSDLIDRIEVMTNSARTHLENFKHMLQPSQEKVSTTMVLDVTSPVEDEEDVQIIDKSNEDEYKSGSKLESKDEEDSPPVMRRIQTQTRVKTTPTKGANRASTS